jgi:hypothetical protein
VQSGVVESPKRDMDPSSMDMGGGRLTSTREHPYYLGTYPDNYNYAPPTSYFYILTLMCVIVYLSGCLSGYLSGYLSVE